LLSFVPFWISDVDELEQQDTLNKVARCFNHIIGLLIFQHMF
jgi:hypothetical protein